MANIPRASSINPILSSISPAAAFVVYENHHAVAIWPKIHTIQTKTNPKPTSIPTRRRQFANKSPANENITAAASYPGGQERRNCYNQAGHPRNTFGGSSGRAVVAPQSQRGLSARIFFEQLIIFNGELLRRICWSDRMRSMKFECKICSCKWEFTTFGQCDEIQTIQCPQGIPGQCHVLKAIFPGVEMKGGGSE